MTTHPRARAFQAGALLAVIGGSLVVAPAPALAKEPSIVITSFSPSNLKGGERATLKFRVTNTNPLLSGGNQKLSMTVSVTPGELRCQGDCSADEVIAPLQSGEYVATLVAGAMPSGASKNGSVVIKATIGGESTEASRSVTVRGDDKPPTAKQVSGRLKDQDGKAIGGALVVLVDSQNHTYETRSNGSGSYRFFSSDQRPISPGTMQVGASKDGYESKLASGNATANQAVKIDLVLTSTATPSASPSPSPSVSTSATPSTKASTPAEDETTEAPAAATPPPITPAAQSSGDGGSSLLYLVLGGLLVAAGLGAIVLVILRRKDSGSDDEPADGPVAPRPGGAVPAQSRSGPDATRIAGGNATRVVGGMEAHPAEATMVTSAPLPPSLSEAPTMLQQAVPVEDEFPDPYGAPAVVPHAGYQPIRPAAAPAAVPAQPAAYAPAGAYGAPPYAPPAAPAGPTMSAGYAGRQQRYDEPTGMYVPPPGGYQPEPGYDRAQAAGYPPQGDYDGYDQAGQYGQAPQQQYDQAGQYDDADYDHPGYQPEYPPTAGYGQSGYPANAEHVQDPGYAQAGYAPVAGTAVPARPSPGGRPAGGNPAAGRPGPGRPGPGRPAPGRPDPGRPAPGRPAPGRHAPATGYDESGAYPQPAGYPPQQSPATVPYQPDGYVEQPQQYAGWSPGADGDAYGAPAGGHAPEGYDEPAGYDPRAAYGRPEGYGRVPEQQADPHGGYDESRGYFDQAAQPAAPQPGGRHGAVPVPPQAGAAPGQRRLDWLDD